MKDILPNDIFIMKKHVEGFAGRFERLENSFSELTELVKSKDADIRKLERKISEMSDKKAPPRKRKTPTTTKVVTDKEEA